MTYQQEKKMEAENNPAAKNPDFAIVAQVFADGVALRFNDTGQATSSHWPVITGHTYRIGQRVAVQKIASGWLVLGPVGYPDM